jgi:Glucuronyl esterase, fungi
MAVIFDFFRNCATMPFRGAAFSSVCRRPGVRRCDVAKRLPVFRSLTARTGRDPICVPEEESRQKSSFDVNLGRHCHGTWPLPGSTRRIASSRQEKQMKDEQKNGKARCAGPTRFNHDSQPKEGENAMLTFNRISALAQICLGAAVLLLGTVTSAAQGQPAEDTSADSVTPLVYNVENTGATSVAPTFPSFADLPIVRPLPDPFVYLSTGARDTSFGAWEQHRNEILDAFESYMVGPKPDCADCAVTASYITTSTNHYTLTVKVTRTNPTNRVVTDTFTSAITLPSGTPPASGWPYVITVDGGAYTSAFPSASIARVAFTSSQVTRSDSPSATDAFYKMYYPLCSGLCPNLPAIPGYPNYNGDSGQFAAWAWGVSRLLDGIQIVAAQATDPLPLDTTYSAITGCSYAGKIALFAGALDERIALTASEESGGGGISNWRYSYDADSEYALGSHNGSVEDIDTTDHRWWATALMHTKFSSVDVYKLPIDLHEVAALTAPRALVESANTNSYWLGNGSNYVSARAIQRVYNTFGIGDRFGFIVNGNHGHCSPPSSETAYVAQFVNKFVLGQDVSTDVEIHPDGQPTDGYGTGQNPKHYYPVDFSTMDYGRWTNWWGSEQPVFSNDWNTGGTVDLSFNNHSDSNFKQPITINTGDTVEAGYTIQMPTPDHPAAIVTLPNANIQTDVTCSDGSSYTLYIPLYPNTNLVPSTSQYGVGQTYVIPANSLAWYPSANPNSPTTYQGSATVSATNIMGSTVNPGCANGGPGQAGRVYFVALGAQDKNNGDPAGPGFVTTDTTQSPLAVRFHLADTTTGKGGQWSPPVVIHQLPIN